jgi:hypothetical protein
MAISNKQSKLRFIVFALLVFNSLFFFHNFSFAQKSSSSPYSRYGVGDIGGKGFGQGFAMGGTYIAMQNDSMPLFFINNGNPASYTNNRLTTAELGANYNRIKLESSTAKSKVNNASLAYISMAFPIKKWWGASIGIIPFSSVGYKVSDHQVITNVGSVNFLYEGTGGINQVYFGNGIKPFNGLPHLFGSSKKYQRLKAEKNEAAIFHILKRKKAWQGLSLGANASYLFGNFENTRRSIFPASAFAFNTRTGTTTQVSGLYFDYGMQYAINIDSIHHRDLKDNVKIVIGANFAAQTNITAKIDSLSYSYFNNSLGYEIVKDTIENTKGAKGNITLPLSFGFGIAIKKGGWLVAADYAAQNWSQYKLFNQTQGLKNSMRVSLGAQFIPSSKINASYPERMNYRIGVRYAQTALELKNTPLVEYAGSIGIGFPVGRNWLLRTFSMVNIGVEVGQRGTITNGLIKENFLKATVGFTINDQWFQKPKID